MKSNAVKSKNISPGVYCSSRSFEHIFPAILKTVHSDKSNGNKKLTVSINHNRAMHSPKLFSALSLIIVYRNTWLGNTIIILLKIRSRGFNRAQYCYVNQI